MRFLFLLIVFLYSCGGSQNKDAANTSPNSPHAPGTFGYDLAFLSRYHPDLVVLGDDTSGARVIIAPAYQARVMTSTTNGNGGPSFGWINHAFIADGKTQPHMNPYGGEERFWLGPEGGQFSFYFPKDSPFVFNHWQVPKELDTEPFKLVTKTLHKASFSKDMLLKNYSGTEFSIKVDREIILWQRDSILNTLGLTLPSSAKLVGFETVNTITNTGSVTWDRKTGIPSIWILSMLNASPSTSVLVPWKPAAGRILTDDYFGKVPAERLTRVDGVIYFKADGNYRSKIGLSPQASTPYIGSYDSLSGTLTLARFSLPGATDYVNALWKLQDDPFSGDAVNAYNDGPVDGKQMGKFYEIESSSPAAALNPGSSLTHRHLTLHIVADSAVLDNIASKFLHTHLHQIPR